ncbi:MAG: hypothetical protein JWL69_2505, partial [Phycisphaerales bacterium]|nr:hypothetical protein [Phycisphaerales bacterium]
TGQIITGSVNFPAGFSNKVIEVIPINDGTPQWMRTVTATEGSAADTQTDSTPATVAIGGGNFGLTVGNGSDNQIFQASSDGTQHLVPVALNLPTTIVPGSTVTLVIDSLVPIDVWATDTPQPGDTPLNASGNTITWTESLNPPIVVPAIIFIGVKDGSTQLNPIAMKLIPEDAPPPTNPPPGHHYPPPPPPPPPSRKREDAMDLRIISHNDPNGDVPDGSDVTGQSRKWLIGQVADLEAQIVGPLGIGAGPIYQWTVTGNQQPLYGYDEGNYYRHAIPLAPFNDFLNGTSERDVHFFWTSTSAPPPGFDANVVSVSALSSGFGTLSAQTTLNTYSPPVSSVAGQYAPGFNAGATAVGLFSPPTSSDPQGLSGVFISAAVKDPAGFNQGAWAYLQKIMPSEHYTTDTGIGHHNDSSRPIGKNYYQLDTLIDPGTEDGVQVSPAVVTYPNYPWQSLADKYTSADGTAWPTGTTTHMFGDAPLLGLNKRNEASIDDAFRTWIMYLPTSGAASEPSQWVPVMSVDWAVKVQAVKNANGVWTLAATPTPAAYKALTLQRSTEVPQWDNWADVKTDTWPTP